MVIPTYNEADNLPALVQALLELPLEGLHILVVDDNSPDGTGQVAAALAAAYTDRLSLLQRPARLGLGSAYLSGFRWALERGASAIAQMDADFSHPPQKLVDLHRALENHAVALGSRYVTGGGVDQHWPLWRKGLSAWGNLYARAILGLRVRDATGGFRLWRREALSSLPLDQVRSNGYVFQIEMVYLVERLGLRWVEVPFYFADRQRGRSKMSLRIQIEAAFRVWQLRYRYRHLPPARGRVPLD